MSLPLLMIFIANSTAGGACEWILAVSHQLAYAVTAGDLYRRTPTLRHVSLYGTADALAQSIFVKAAAISIDAGCTEGEKFPRILFPADLAVLADSLRAVVRSPCSLGIIKSYQ